MINRRSVLYAGLAAPFVAPGALQGLAPVSKALKKRVRIVDLKAMLVKAVGTERPLVKIETDAGITGYGESYPGRGIKEIIQGYLRPLVIGEDPLDVERLYTKMVQSTGGTGSTAGTTVTAIGGVEIALWDLAGKVLGVPVCKLLGGQYRDRVRAYSTRSPKNLLDFGSCREFAEQLKNNPYGFTIVKTDFLKKSDPREPHHVQLNNQDIANNATGFANLREALSPSIEIAVHCHWELDWIDALRLARAVAPTQPCWLEDPMPPAFSDTWVKLTEQSPVPILTGENLYTRQGFKPFILQQGCHIVHIDIPKAGGLLESKKIADLADLFQMPVCAHCHATPLAFMASAHCAASIRNFKAQEHSVGPFEDIWEKLIVPHEPLIKDGFIQLTDTPGLGIELNEDYMRNNLAPNEVWWGNAS